MAIGSRVVSVLDSGAETSTFLFLELEGKYSLESTDPCESEIRAHLRP